ncbi:MAG TPA: type IV toxin-antitoxin system AbiEi family antitoxin domain-containing protein [Steroidobacteraceae bacterium]|jgi:predicted transcriptional regulator of viral defense system
MPSTRNVSAAIEQFRRRGGTLRTREALEYGIHPATLYFLRDAGRITVLARGLYKLADELESGNPDLAVVAARAPNAAICLVSALAFHDITTQIPAAVQLAVPRGAYSKIKLDPLPVRVFRFDPKTFEIGLEFHNLGSARARIYNPARAIVDSFKFRNKLGLDIALEALRLSRERKKVSNKDLLYYARLLRVERVLQPYLMALA